MHSEEYMLKKLITNLIYNIFFIFLAHTLARNEFILVKEVIK
jgi:hypothetical protein